MNHDGSRMVHGYGEKYHGVERLSVLIAEKNPVVNLIEPRIHANKRQCFYIGKTVPMCFSKPFFVFAFIRVNSRFPPALDQSIIGLAGSAGS